MAHAQKPDFVFRRNGRVHLSRRGTSVQSTTGSRGLRISGSNAGYTMFRGNVKGTGYPLHSPVSPSLPLPCVTVCHHISTGNYNSNRYLGCGRHAPAAFPPRRSPGTPNTGGWVNPRTGLDGCERGNSSCLHRAFEPRSVQLAASRFTDYAITVPRVNDKVGRLPSGRAVSHPQYSNLYWHRS